jgi:4-hydroxybenzoate polyprenyltransferase
VRPYLELLRPANVITALADVLAGCAVGRFAAPAAVPWLLGATACLYAGGVVLNDYCDRDIDARERPERPIPSGRVAAQSALLLGVALLAGGAGLALGAGAVAGLVALATAGAVVLYDAWGKRQRWAGPPIMGLCRGLNLALGLAAVPAVLAHSWPLTLMSFVYITAVTAVSRGEVHGGGRAIGLAALISLGAIVAALAWLGWAGASRVTGLLLGAVLAWRVLPAFYHAWRTPVPAAIRRAIRAGVLSLVYLDAVLAAAYAGAAAAVPILLTAVAAGWLARRFAVT